MMTKQPVQFAQMFKVGESDDESAQSDWLGRAGYSRIWYYYKSGDYEGSGVALLEREGRWNEKNLGHCSCYGPWDDLPTKESDVDTLDELQAKCSKDYYADELAPLFAAARAATLNDSV